MKWQAVIGLEIHVQLSTASKIFSAASTRFGAEPNTQASAVDLGLPGVLPVVNKEVYKKAVAFGLAIGGTIALTSVFDRKNYFYPDLPKGYQITQLDHPIVMGGRIEIRLQNNSTKTINITRAHLEEDAGKSLHDGFHGMSGIDLNRAGTPLLEIVSEPEMSSALEAVAYARAIHQLVCYLDVSDGNMAEGSLRCDANVSLRRPGQQELGTRTETKNVNSFRFLERAINFEIARQADVLESGNRVVQETLLYDPDRDETRPMRSKETATDYRYFPEPDLLPVQISEAYVESIRSNLPELPGAKRVRYVADFGLAESDSLILSNTREVATYFEEVVDACQDPRLATNWVRVELLGKLKREHIEIGNIPVSATKLAGLILRIKDNTISSRTAKEVLDEMWTSAESANHVIQTKGLRQVTDISSIEPIVDRIVAENPKLVQQFRSGREKVLAFFVGQVMKETEGKASPQQVNALLRAKLAAPKD